MGQLIVKKVKKVNETKKNVFSQLDGDGYLKANFSVDEIKNMFNTFGNLEQYLTKNAK